MRAARSGAARNARHEAGRRGDKTQTYFSEFEQRYATWRVDVACPLSPTGGDYTDFENVMFSVIEAYELHQSIALRAHSRLANPALTNGDLRSIAQSIAPIVDGIDIVGEMYKLNSACRRGQ